MPNEFTISGLLLQWPISGTHSMAFAVTCFRITGCRTRNYSKTPPSLLQLMACSRYFARSLFETGSSTCEADHSFSVTRSATASSSLKTIMVNATYNRKKCFFTLYSGGTGLLPLILPYKQGSYQQLE